MGKRQIFVRFAGCNISCKYCDTKDSITDNLGEEYSYEKLNQLVQSLITPDFDSLEITGGEPLLHAEYIKEFLSKYPYRAMIETNATLPKGILMLKDVIDLVSMDIKLPEHFDCDDAWIDVYNSELESIKIMESNNISYYIKIVVSPTTSLSSINKMLADLDGLVSKDVNIIVQPVSPMSLWDNKANLFKISETIGKLYSVSIIPQMHKYLNVE